MRGPVSMAKAMWSERTSWDLSESELSVATRAARAAGRTLHDLTVSNPTHCGFVYPADLLAELSAPAAREYDPDPLGMRAAREAVSAYYRDHGVAMDAGNICLTTSTSEGYSFLFRTLCDPGDEVLIARPSYPLFDYIARLDGVVLREYPLHYDPGADAGEGSAHAWSIDFHALESAITLRTRAVVVVHPNNPTGNFASDEERAALESLCTERGLALIVDEVFLDYGHGEADVRSFAKGEAACLTFVLSGLSKVCALPQMKVSWIVTRGPQALVREAMARLEMVADTFLSLNAPVQHAVPRWLRERHGIQEQIRERVRGNVALLDARLRGTAAQRLALEGGWTAVLRVPRTVDGVAFAEAALAHDVIVQPGEFYGLPAGRAVVSLLTPPEMWRAGLELLPID